jgi:hypothetical protein
MLPRRRTVHVVGAGPTGLTVAGALADAGDAVALYDASGGDGMGTGTWAGAWAGTLYTKHSPQVAWGAYTHARAVLAARGLAWDDYFVQTSSLPWAAAALKGMSAADVAALTGAFVAWRARSVLRGGGGGGAGALPETATVEARFRAALSARGYATLGHLCRFFDGVGPDRMLVHELFLAADQVGGTGAYRAARASDTGFPARWLDAVRALPGVSFRAGARLESVRCRAGGGYDLSWSSGGGAPLSAGAGAPRRGGASWATVVPEEDDLVLALDPVALLTLLDASDAAVAQNWGPSADTARRVAAGAYQPISVQIHFRAGEAVPRLPGGAEVGLGTDWAVAAMTLPFTDKAGGRSITCAVLDLTARSAVTGRSAAESPAREVMAECERQVRAACKAGGVTLPRTLALTLDDASSAWDATARRWRFGRSAAALSPWGFLPQTGALPRLRAVGLYSARTFAPASLEAAVEAGLSAAVALSPRRLASHPTYRALLSRTRWTVTRRLALASLVALALAAVAVAVTSGVRWRAGVHAVARRP